MHIEIERKFLVTGTSWMKNATSMACKQGYIYASPKKTIRIRIMADKGYITIKGKNQGIGRKEFEYVIPLEDANRLLLDMCDKPLIEKTRYLVNYQGFNWEVDAFEGDNKGLVIAEIELTDENQQFPKPPWLGEEVTGDSRYYNASLQKKPFALW